VLLKKGSAPRRWFYSYLVATLKLISSKYHTILMKVVEAAQDVNEYGVLLKGCLP
jgi:hypothetical protein